MKSFIVKFKDEDGKERAVEVKTKHDLIAYQHGETLAAFLVSATTGYVVERIIKILNKEDDPFLSVRDDQ